MPGPDDADKQKKQLSQVFEKATRSRHFGPWLNEQERGAVLTAERKADAMRARLAEHCERLRPRWIQQEMRRQITKEKPLMRPRPPVPEDARAQLYSRAQNEVDRRIAGRAQKIDAAEDGRAKRINAAAKERHRSEVLTRFEAAARPRKRDQG